MVSLVAGEPDPDTHIHISNPNSVIIPTDSNPILTDQVATPILKSTAPNIVTVGTDGVATRVAYPGVINTDHAYGYTGNLGYYNGYYNNWGGYRPLYTITQDMVSLFVNFVMRK